MVRSLQPGILPYLTQVSLLIFRVS